MEPLEFDGNKPDFEEEVHFVPTFKIAWVIGNSNYNNVVITNRLGKEIQMHNIEQAPQDIQQMGELFAQLKFDEIVSCSNGNFDEI